jgi:hypothetical protein
MTRIKTIGLALLAVFAFSAIAATAAQAEGTEKAPYWSIEGTRLAAGKTFEIVAKAVGNQTLTAGANVVTCTAFKLKPGAVLLGSSLAGEPGKSDETIQYSGCTVAGNGTGCTVTGGTIETEPLTNELVYSENKKSLQVELFPVKGKVLAEFHFTAPCTILSSKVTGVVVAGVFTGAAENPVLLELPNTVTQGESFKLKIIEKAKPPVWLIKAGTGELAENEELNAFGVSSILSGTALIQLAVHGTAVTTKWSPLL